jgi:murein tripeptide amidase MpaA
MYLNVDEVDTAVVNLATTYSTICTLITLPNTTFETRTCHALRLGGGAAGSRDCVTIIGGQHAREWGSCEILVGLAADLLDAYTNNTGLAYGGKNFTAAQIQTLLNGLHLIVFPLVNPDGRAYSQLNDAVHTDGGWRKNRNPANNGGATRATASTSTAITISCSTCRSSRRPRTSPITRRRIRAS